METVKKYFIPSEKNEYKPHFFRKASIGLLSLIAVLIFFAGVFHISLIQKTDLLSAVIPKVIVSLTNVNRTTDKLSELKINPILEDAAQRKANHMAAGSYFSHNSPNGITPWYWFKEAGYEYLYAGENLAVNFADSEDVDRAWMNSPTHRANILSGKFTEIGVATSKGIYKGRETIFVVQLFGRPLPSFAKKILDIKKTESSKATTTASTTPPQKNPIATSTPTTTPTRVVKQASKVLGDTESFVSITNPEVDEETERIALDMPLEKENREMDNAEQASEAETLLASPKRTVSTLYVALASIIIFALLLLIFVEIRRQSPRHIALGIVLLILVLVLFYVFQDLFVSEVIVV